MSVAGNDMKVILAFGESGKSVKMGPVLASC